MLGVLLLRMNTDTLDPMDQFERTVTTILHRLHGPTPAAIGHASLFVHPSSAVSFGLFLQGDVRELNLDALAPEANQIFPPIWIVDYWLVKP